MVWLMGYFIYMENIRRIQFEPILLACVFSGVILVPGCTLHTSSNIVGAACIKLHSQRKCAIRDSKHAKKQKITFFFL